MKRSWTTTLLIAGVIVVLTSFLGLQYYWLQKASEAEREQLQKRVENDAKNFADDFNKLIQSAYFNFQLDASTWKNADYAEFNKRYEYWKNNTEYPDLIREIDLIQKDSSEPALRFQSEKQGFFAVEASDELLAVRNTIALSDPVPNILDDGGLLVVPIFDSGERSEKITIRRVTTTNAPQLMQPKAYAFLLIFLNKQTVTEKILPALSSKYFGTGDFVAKVDSRSGGTVFQTRSVSGIADATAPLYDLHPDSFIFFTNRELQLPRTHPGPGANVVFDQHVESRTVTESNSVVAGTGETLKIEVQAGGAARKRTAVISTNDANSDPWTLSVQHTSGSVDAYIRSEMIRSFLIGLGIYFLLVGSILAIVISALRSKRFAQRQIDFVSSVSHEFRTPLAVIYSASDNLADGVAKDEHQIVRYGNLIKGEGKKLSAMVEQILEFAGARSGRKKYNFVEADVGAITKDALDVCSAQLEDAGFQVETNISNSLPKVEADAETISTAIQNLVLNSIKYSRDEKWILVSAENGSGTVKISVEDRGIGIAKSEQTQIFEPFYRSKEVVDSQIHGSGLGLSLVQEIARAHGGRVNVASEPGNGSKFTIELPQR